MAYIVPAAGVERQGGTEFPDRMQAHCEQRLARFKVPAEFEIFAELPYSANGKVAKARLRPGHGM